MQFIQFTHSYAATGFVQAYQTPSNRLAICVPSWNAAKSKAPD